MKKMTVMENIIFAIRRIAASKTAMIISGTACAVPFVFESMFWLSWIMYIPIAVMFFDGSMNASAKAGRVFLFGYAYYFTGYLWISELYPLDFVGIGKFHSVLIIILALTAIPAIHAGMLVLSFVVCDFSAGKNKNWLKLIVFPCVFVFCEYLQSVGPLAFSWCRVSVAQTGCIAIVQSVSLVGSYFITYLVLLVNGFIAYGLLDKNMRKILLISAASLFLINFAFGVLRIAVMEQKTQNAQKFTAIALQGNIPSSEKWEGDSRDALNLYMNLAKSAVLSAKEENMPENTLILIPETALPFILRENGLTAQTISDFAKENDICFAAGAFSDMGESSGNSVYMFTPDGKMSEPYTKRHLVPFGEYLPYRSFFETFLPALAQMNVLSQDIYKATEASVFDIPFAKAGAVICYESIFPELCRETVGKGAQILLVSTNDSWFGDSGALRHHLANARLRAIENGVSVIRAANTGISALITPDGKAVKTLGANRRGFIKAQLPLKTTTTLYSLIGDVWLYLCVVIVMVSIYKKKKSV